MGSLGSGRTVTILGRSNVCLFSPPHTQPQSSQLYLALVPSSQDKCLRTDPFRILSALTVPVLLAGILPARVVSLTSNAVRSRTVIPGRWGGTGRVIREHKEGEGMNEVDMLRVMSGERRRERRPMEVEGGPEQGRRGQGELEFDGPSASALLLARRAPPNKGSSEDLSRR